jgi:Protein of unknown function (DUF3106)
MMRNIAIGLAAATIAIGGSALSASALSGQQNGISKGMSGSVKSQRFGPRTYGFYDEGRGNRYDEGRGNRSGELTPFQRERLRGIARELADLTPLQRERLRGIMRDRFAELTPIQRERLRGIARQLADLTPLQRERLREIMRERFGELTPLQRERMRGIARERYEQFGPAERERPYRQGPYGRR